jgi:hypothetical protein
MNTPEPPARSQRITLVTTPTHLWIWWPRLGVCDRAIRGRGKANCRPDHSFNVRSFARDQQEDVVKQILKAELLLRKETT